MVYRTRTYIAADWTGDTDAITQLKKWNNSNYWSLDFTDAHELTQSRDESLKCTIKNSLKSRLDSSKTFVLIVGTNTNLVRSGTCTYCRSYNSYTYHCARGYYVDYRSYIDYECDEAVKAYQNGVMNIIVLYNYASVDKSKCPEVLRNIGTHKAMCEYSNGNYFWDYLSVKSAFGK